MGHYDDAENDGREERKQRGGGETVRRAEKTRKEVYTVVERGAGKDDFWCRIGTAWVNKDGSLNVVLDALPVNGKLHIRSPKSDNGSSS
jgi:hypothetical protein